MGSLPNLNAIGLKSRRDADYSYKVTHQRLPASHQQPPPPPLMMMPPQTPTEGVRYQQQHRHSLTARKVHRTRSSGTTNHIWDDPAIEMTCYSPLIPRNHRLHTNHFHPNVTTASGQHCTQQANQPQQHHFHHHGHHGHHGQHPQAGGQPPPPPLAPYQIHQHQHSSGSRRRESVNSSIGANSIRHLLSIRRSIGYNCTGSGGGTIRDHRGIANSRSSGTGGLGAGCRHKFPPHVKAKVARNFAILCAAHALSCAILVPLFGLQGSSSAWLHRADWLRLGPNVGSGLLAACSASAAATAPLTQRLLQRIGYVSLLLIAYAALGVFVLAHIYPTVWSLIPAYVLLGATLAPAFVSKWNLVVFFASRISCGQQECAAASDVGDSMEVGITGSSQRIGGVGGGSVELANTKHCGRDERIRRLARWYHAAENAGIIAGAVLATVVMTQCGRWGCEVFGGVDAAAATVTKSTTTMAFATTAVPPVQNTTSAIYDTAPLFQTQQQQQLMLDVMFNVDAHGARICGADACPRVDVWWLAEVLATNASSLAAAWERPRVDSHAGATPLMLAFLVLAVAALVLTACSSNVDNTFKRATGGARSWTDTIMFAGPMAYFIGTEQAYVLGDFTKAFVSCSLGLQTVAGALVGMGLMQLVVGCTLSMLLRHTKRYAVLAAGFFFHACLLLVLFSWKPSTDDSALFYAIAAAWGACNAMWETLLFALITLTHVGHVVAVAARVQALRYAGLAVTFAAHGLLCEQAKITCMFVLLCVTVVPYGMLEVRLEAQRRNHHVQM